MLASNVIPIACQNPIGLNPSMAPTKHTFHKNCSGKPNNKHAPMNMNNI